MLKIYKYPEIKNKLKDGASALDFGLQIAKNYQPLTFQFQGNNSAIVSFNVISVDVNGMVLETINLSTAIILQDTGNNLYYVDGGTNYTDTLCEGIYYFEIKNGLNKFESEYFEVKEESEFLTFDNNHITFDNNTITFDNIKI